jgi:hypothetical protein
MNLFWVLVPGTVLLIIGLVAFEWTNRKEQLSKAAAAAEEASEKSNNQAG